jgi:7-cyano-7-deazaguanine synthase
VTSIDSGEGTLVLSGGGLDTLVAAYEAKRRFPDERMHLVYFDYGAKAHRKEETATYHIISALSGRYPKVTWRLYGIPFLHNIVTDSLVTSSLTDDRKPVNKDPQPGVPSEWVPARNTVLMSLGLAIAESSGFARIVTGINKQAAIAYPDNHREWNDRFQHLVPYALGPGRYVKLEAPLQNLMKSDIVLLGATLGVPFSISWSCYEGDELHCGECSSCRARREAFTTAGVVDSTRYAR